MTPQILTDKSRVEGCYFMHPEIFKDPFDIKKYF